MSLESPTPMDPTVGGREHTVTMGEQDSNGMSMPPAEACRWLAGFMDWPTLAQCLGVSDPLVQARYAEQHVRALAAAHRLPVCDVADIGVRSFSPSELEWAERVMQLPAFAQEFGGTTFEFGYVPIGRLMSLQTNIRGHHRNVPAQPEEVLRWCLPTEFRTSATCFIAAFTGLSGQLVFATHDPFSMFNIQTRPDGVAELKMAPRLNWVQVARAGGRYLIRNGYHRVVAMIAAGHKEVPALVVSYPDLPSAILPGPGWIAAQYLSLPRPPLVIDFMNRALTIEGSLPPGPRLLELRFTISDFTVPRVAR